MREQNIKKVRAAPPWSMLSLIVTIILNMWEENMVKKNKILILPGGLHIGGAERVAANISKYAPDDIFEFHYLVFDCHENVYGSEIESKGGKIISVPLPRRNYLAYIKTLAALMKENRYTAVHSHTMFNSGINLAVAKYYGIPVRIAHSHTTKTEHRVPMLSRIYTSLMRMIILATATHRIGCGVDAGMWLFGKKAFEKNGIVLRNGIDVSSFALSMTYREKIRRDYGIEDAFVIGHTGTLAQVKNQIFLIELLPEILRKKPNAVLLLVGGDESGEINKLRAAAQKCNVTDRVIFTGAVLNENEHLSAFDVFAFPSKREGTPLALLEAQANGLPCIVSKNVPDDAFLTELITTVPLDDSAKWVEEISTARRSGCSHYSEQIRQAGYDAVDSYNQIYDIYRGRENPRKAVVSLSFDDGRGDNTKVLDEILIPRQIPTTLNITTGYIDGTCPEELRPTNKQPMAKEDVIRLGKHPLIEIALHGNNHQNTPEDIFEGRKKLIDWLELKENHLFGFASPGSALTPAQWNSDDYADVREKLLYMRSSYRIETCKHLRTLCRKMGRIIHIPVLYSAAYAQSKMAFRDKKIVYSACVLKETSYRQVRTMIDLCIRTNTSLTLMFHSILPDCGRDDVWSWDTEKFEKLCRYLVEKREAGKLELCTTKQMYEKMQ